MNEDFNSVIGYPDGVPDQVESTSFEYYKVPRGLYDVVIGKMRFLYQDINGKKCTADEPTAVFKGQATIPFWLLEWDGTADIPQKQNILGLSLQIPANKPVNELYFPNFLSWKPEDQWKNLKAYADFHIEGIPESKVVIINPSKPTSKTVNFKALAKYYYGMKAKINVLWSAKDNPFLDTTYGIKLTGERMPLEKMTQFEVEIESKLAREKEERQQQQNQNKPSEYTPPADVEDTDFDSFINGENS